MQQSTPNQTTSSTQTSNLLAHYRSYTQSRKKFLAEMGLPTSCRDPFAEFSEILVAKLLDASTARSRVQKGYDLVKSDGRRVQVRYLCNPSQGWVNEHYIYFDNDVDDYALVIIEGLDLSSVLFFPKETIGQVATLLKKRHPKRDRSIQFTQRNYRTIHTNQADFAALGVETYRFPEL